MINIIEVFSLGVRDNWDFLGLLKGVFKFLSSLSVVCVLNKWCVFNIYVVNIFRVMWMLL